MAQFDILATGFTSSGELEVTIDNPDLMSLHTNPTHDVPSDVEIVPQGSSPTQQLWVHQQDYHLTITLSGEDGDNPLTVTNTDYLDGEDDLKYVDIVIAEFVDSTRKGKNLRRKARQVRL